MDVQLTFLIMRLSERTYFEDTVKMDAIWVVIFILVSSIGTLAISIAAIMDDVSKSWTEIGVVTGVILLSDTFIVLLFRNMRLEIATTKLAFHYRMFPIGKMKSILWNEIVSVRSHKMKNSGYGKKYKMKYGTAYIMNTKPGIEFTLSSGKKLFVSVNDAEDFKRSIRKLELPLIIE